MKKNIFILVLFLYMLAFNILVINAITNQGILANFITGNVVYLDANPAADPKFILPLFLFNAAIIGLFVLSYHNYNLYHKLTTKKHSKA